MSENLVIVESPAKSKTIEKYLGQNYRVISTVGHLRNLPSKEGIDVNNNYRMNYELIDVQTLLSSASNLHLYACIVYS